MKKILIDQSVAKYRRMIKKRIAGCIIVGIIIFGINLLCVMFRTEQNHNVMLLLNIITDIIAGYLITYYTSFYILPQRRRLKFSQKPTVTVSGKISAISEDTIRVLGFDCFSVFIGEKKVFLPDCSRLWLNTGEHMVFGTVMNIVTEAEL